MLHLLCSSHERHGGRDSMENVNRLYVGLLTALALCKYSLASWNATEEPASPTESLCHHHSNGNNCTVTTATTETPWSGHFSECPEELRYYCIHGDCRYVTEQKTPSCRCHDGYMGHRCEYLNLGWLTEERQIIIYCSIAGLVVLILFIVFIWIYAHHRSRRRGMRRRREGTGNGTEKLPMMDTNVAHSVPESAEPTHTYSA
ncbi:probetacellulin [Neosynchiropus ocellatus]